MGKICAHFYSAYFFSRIPDGPCQERTSKLITGKSNLNIHNSKYTSDAVNPRSMMSVLAHLRQPVRDA